MKNVFLPLIMSFVLISGTTNAQDWWTKTKKEAIPEDLTASMLLIEKFKTRKLDDAPAQAFMDQNKRDEHPLIKKTNNQIDTYNEELREKCKKYSFPYKVVSRKKTEDTEKYPLDQARYVLKHEVYLRRFQRAGNMEHYYTYVYFFYDRKTRKEYPYIYLFEKKRLASLDKLIEYLNTL